MDYKRAAYTLRMMKRTAFPSADEREAIDFAMQVLKCCREKIEITNFMKMNMKMKKKFFVPSETARALKAAGYNEKCDYYYLFGLPFFFKCYAAPTYHEVVDWLEEKGIIVIADLNMTSNGVTDKWVGMWWSSNKKQKNGTYYCYNTREEALNAAILAALEVVQ